MDVGDFILSRPWNEPVYEDSDLGTPCRHLLGNRIQICPQGRCNIDVSAWRMRSNSGFYQGVIHVSHSYQEEIVLVEDVIIPTMPEDFPIIFERATHPELAICSLFYPNSNQKWKFKIHLRHHGSPVEEADLLLEQRLSSFLRPGLFEVIG